MGPCADRRDFLKALSVTGIGASLTALAGVQIFSKSAELDRRPIPKTGLPADVRWPSQRHHPGTTSVLLIDGRVLRLTGFIGAMQMHSWVQSGLGREISHFADTSSDAQKLRILGRNAFASKLSRETLWPHWNEGKDTDEFST